MLVPILPIRRCPLVLRSVRARFLLSYLQLRAYGSHTAGEPLCMHEQSALLGFNCDPMTKPHPALLSEPACSLQDAVQLGWLELEASFRT